MKKQKSFYIMTGLLLLGLVLTAAGMYTIIKNKQSRAQGTTSKINSSVSESTDNPSEDKVSPDAPYSVAPDMPRRIFIPTIRVNGFVQQVSIDQHGAIGVPDNINLAGWFTGSARPGEDGVSIIDGHVSGRYYPGIFKNLERINVGDKFEVEFGDLSRRQFEVVSAVSYNTSEIDKRMLEKSQNIDNQLNLITCTGRFIRETDQYENRLLVVSKRIDQARRQE